MKRPSVKYLTDKFRLNFKQVRNLISTLVCIISWKWKICKYIAPAPLILMVEPTNRCNFRCPLCDRGVGKLKRAEGDLSLERFCQLIDMTGGRLKMLLLWNQGEPLLNRHITEFIEYAKERSIFCVVSTNGSLLESKGKELIDAGLDELIVSLDGASPETFALYRQGGDFRKIVSSVKDLTVYRGKKSKPLISLQFLLLKHNIGEMGEFKRLGEELGADRILWKTAQAGSNQEAEEYLPEAGEFSRYKGYQRLELKRKRSICRRIFYSAVIDWNGNMTACCFDKDEDYVMGNVFEAGLEQVWRGQRFNKFRRDILQGKTPAMCGNCTEGLERMFITEK